MNHAVIARGRFAGVGGFANHPWLSEQPYDEAWGPPDPHERHGAIRGTLAPWVSTKRYRQDKAKALPRPKHDEPEPERTSTWLVSIAVERARAQCEAEQLAAYQAVLRRWERRLKPIHWKAST